MSASEPPDVARLRAALAALGDEPGAPVEAERIFSALHGNVSAEERQAVIDELVTNADAAEAWRLAKELAPEGTAATAAPAKRAVWTWMPLAAGVVLALGLGWQFFNPWRAAPPAYRSVDQRTIASELPPGAPLPRAAPVLRWTPIEGARYRVSVLTPVLEPVEEAEDLTVAEYRLSEEALRRLPSGAQLLWQVEARIPGAAGVVSPTFSVRLE